MVDPYRQQWFPDYPGQRMQDDPQYINWLNQQQQARQLTQPQTPAPQMTPFIDARMLQVNSIAEAEAFRLEPSQSQLFYTADRAAFIVKEQGQTGYNLLIYDRRPPEPQKPPIDPTQFVTWDGLEKRLEAISAPKAPRSKLNSGGEQ